MMRMPETAGALRLALPPAFAPAGQSAGLDSLAAAPRRAALLAEAERLGVLPAVARRLVSDRHPRVREIAARNLWLAREQGRVLKLLADAGVRATAVKGVNLARRLYPDASWREVDDIDLLVDRSDAARACAVLCGSGLTPNHRWTPEALSRQLSRPLFLAPELVFTSPSGAMVELHWDWPGGRSAPLDPFVQPEHYLVYLCRHAAKHFWSSMKWLCDLQLFVSRFGATVDWELFWRVAGENGAETGCAASLELCRRAFGGLPAPGLAQRLSRNARKLVNQAESVISNPAADRPHPVWTQIQLAPWRFRPALVRTWILPQPQDWSRAREQQQPSWQTVRRRFGHLWQRWAFHKIRKLSAKDWGILLEAYFTLIAAECARRLVPARWLLRAAKGRLSSREAGPQAWTLEQLRRIAWLVEAAANRQPVTTRCLTRSIALSWMLARRGVRPALQIGVKNDSGKLQAHAWVEWQGHALQEPVNQAGEYVALDPLAFR